MIRVPMGVKCGFDLLNPGTVNLFLYLFRCVDQYIKAMEKNTRTGPAVRHALLPGLNAYLAPASGDRCGNAPAGAQDFYFHLKHSLSLVTQLQLPFIRYSVKLKQEAVLAASVGKFCLY